MRNRLRSIAAAARRLLRWLLSLARGICETAFYGVPVDWDEQCEEALRGD